MVTPKDFVHRLESWGDLRIHTQVQLNWFREIEDLRIKTRVFNTDHGG